MQIGEKVLVRHEGKAQEFEVINIVGEELELSNGVIKIYRKFWEINRRPLNA